ncbi:MAG: MBL fold metallo-hydrolase [Anaerolineae bacterium]
MEWISLTPQVLVLREAIHCGVVRCPGCKAVVIDSGIGDRSGRHILQALRSEGLEPVAVLNTHAHGDHVGGNAYLAREAGACIYAPDLDATIIQQPIWGALCLSGGAEPLPTLTARKLSALPGPLHAVIVEGTLRLAGVKIEAIRLPGHTGSHTGYRVDDVLFLGDALASEEELTQAIPYIYSVSLQLQTLKRLETLDCAWYVPAHSPPWQEIAPLIERNRQAILRTLDCIRRILYQGQAEEGAILRAVLQEVGCLPHRLGELLKMQATVRSHLSHLHKVGQADYTIEDGQLLWQLRER